MFHIGEKKCLGQLKIPFHGHMLLAILMMKKLLECFTKKESKR